MGPLLPIAPRSKATSAKSLGSTAVADANPESVEKPEWQFRKILEFALHCDFGEVNQSNRNLNQVSWGSRSMHGVCQLYIFFPGRRLGATLRPMRSCTLPDLVRFPPETKLERLSFKCIPQ